MSKSKTKRNFNIIDVDDDGDAGNVTRGDDVLEIGKFEEELDQVYDMLNRLTSVDASVSDVAKGDIDAYLGQRQRRQIEEEERKKLVAGCKVTSSKTLIKNKVCFGLLISEFDASFIFINLNISFLLKKHTFRRWSNLLGRYADFWVFSSPPPCV